MNQPPTSPVRPEDESKPMVFAVDDEPMLLELVVLVLEPLGFRVRTFRDPATAVRAFALASPRPAVIVTDYAMHTMNGMELIRDCRRLQPDQKILLVSGTVDETIFHNQPQKPDAFLAKPYPAKQLGDLVKALAAG